MALRDEHKEQFRRLCRSMKAGTSLLVECVDRNGHYVAVVVASYVGADGEEMYLPVVKLSNGDVSEEALPVKIEVKDDGERLGEHVDQLQDPDEPATWAKPRLPN